jgi:hypothetical protein
LRIDGYLLLLSEAQMRRIEPSVVAWGCEAAGDQRHHLRHQKRLRWRDAPREYDPHKTYNLCVPKT